jgi:regulator of RNase E activity RraB
LFAEELAVLFDDLDVETQSTRDPDWKVYFEFLYPRPIDFQRIHNQQVVHALTDHGDDPRLPRDVDHYAYFPDRASRATFRAELEEQGYRISDQAEVEDAPEDHRYRLSFVTHGPVDLQSIDQVTIPLWLRAQELGGHYDGWGCPIAVQQD